MELWQAAFGIAGIGAIVSFVLWSLYRRWLTLPIFQQMTKDQQFNIFVVFLVLTFLFALAGLGTYAYVSTAGNDGSRVELRKRLEDQHAGIKEALAKEAQKTSNPKEFFEFKNNVESKLDKIRDAVKNNEDIRSRETTKDLMRYLDSDGVKILVPASTIEKIRYECNVPFGTLKAPGFPSKEDS